MVVLIVLLVSWLAFRAVGAAGVHALASWQDSARYALGVMFIFTAMAHFNKMKHDLARMIPAYFQRPLLLVHITGVLELLGAAGLMLAVFLHHLWVSGEVYEPLCNSSRMALPAAA